jgi:hypothetical protein
MIRGGSFLFSMFESILGMPHELQSVRLSNIAGMFRYVKWHQSSKNVMILLACSSGQLWLWSQEPIFL